MKIKNKKFFVAVLTAASFLIIILTAVNSVFYSPSGEISLPSFLKKSLAEETAKDPNLYPAKLRVPSINVDAKVQAVGITKNGNMATPNNFTDVGWFKYGTLPGEIGSAVLAGHVDNGLAFPGVFANLNKTKIGDDVYLDTADGKTIHFVVVAKKLYAYNDTTGEIFDQKDRAYLKLITCAGSWLPEQRTHDERLVVTAVKAP